MANMQATKTPMPEQDPNVRNKNFKEVTLGYTAEMAINEAKRCLQCKKPHCVEGCPVNIHIPEFIHEVAEGNFEKAYEIITDTNALPALSGRVCPQETQCESKCVRGNKGEPVAIGRLERFVADWYRENINAMPKKAESNGIKVAVVGSGPSGLTCASLLAKKGYAVSLFEALHTAGGVLVYGIPEFRLPKAIVANEVEKLKAQGVEVMTDMVIGKVLSIDELFESSQEQHLTRIEAMLENEVMLSREDFDYAMNRAQEIARTKHERGRCLTLMSELSMQRARGYMNMAAEYAKQALAEEPEKKVNHTLLGDAMQGCKCDWCCTNHSELIDYYFDFLQAHPEDTLGRMYLLDNLIDDGRLEEAERELAALRARRGEGFYVPMYEGMIAQKRGEPEKAEACFDAMTKTYADDWRAWFERADEYAKQGRDREAIEAYKRGDALQEKPRMTDIQESIAQCCERQKDWAGAIAAYEQIITILREDWALTEGETVAGYEQNIERVKMKRGTLGALPQTPAGN